MPLAYDEGPYDEGAYSTSMYGTGTYNAGLYNEGLYGELYAVGTYGGGTYGSGPYGGAGSGVVVAPVRQVVWDDPTNRFFDSGLDRGVLYPKNRDAVAWNGLISVDETGSESSTAYYMDGRPYLHVPKPKEYQASIKAYTYPEEFSPFMGLEEISDGLYLDSQQSEAFDLCYRTKVSNAVEGNSGGYKIHLVYNATVAPQSISYQTLSDSVSPVEFSWEIQAVPVMLDGHRPTAHVIVDTRRVDQSRIEELEDLIYGGPGTNIQQLPTPQVLFELLSFSEGIVITYLGNGLWTAEGSSDNVQSFANGTFQLLNADAIDNANGTFTVSSSTA